MPKRRKAEQKLEYYRGKIRKLHEKENKKVQRRVRAILSDSEENASMVSIPFNGDPTINIGEISIYEQSAADAEPEPGASSNALQSQPADTPREDLTPAPELDPEILQALGANTSDGPVYGGKIHKNLAQLWLPLLKKGMSKEDKETTFKQYLFPQNCNLLQAPRLNLEISAALDDSVRNKDENFVVHQQQLGLGIIAINRAMGLLLSKKNDGKLDALKHLSNACRILCDLHHSFSQVRMKLISSTLDKGFPNIIQDCHWDDTLFGAELSGKIKLSETIEKQDPIVSAPYATTSRSAQGRENRIGSPRSYTKSAGGGNKKAAPPARNPSSQTPSVPQTRQTTRQQQARAQQQH